MILTDPEFQPAQPQAQGRAQQSRVLWILGRVQLQELPWAWQHPQSIQVYHPTKYHWNIGLSACVTFQKNYYIKPKREENAKNIICQLTMNFLTALSQSSGKFCWICVTSVRALSRCLSSQLAHWVVNRSGIITFKYFPILSYKVNIYLKWKFPTANYDMHVTGVCSIKMY